MKTIVLPWAPVVPAVMFGLLLIASTWRLAVTLGFHFRRSFLLGFNGAMFVFSFVKMISSILYIIPEYTVVWNIFLDCACECVTLTVLLCLYTHWSQKLNFANRGGSKHVLRGFISINLIGWIYDWGVTAIELSFHHHWSRVWWSSALIDVALAIGIGRCAWQARKLQGRYRRYFDVGLALGLRRRLVQFEVIMSTTAVFFGFRVVARYFMYNDDWPDDVHHAWWWDITWQVSGFVSVSCVLMLVWGMVLCRASGYLRPRSAFRGIYLDSIDANWAGHLFPTLN